MSAAPHLHVAPGHAEPDSAPDPVDPRAVASAFAVFKFAVKAYHRAEVSGTENIPDGGALIVSNHSGGVLAMDVPLIAVAFWERFGLERPLRVLAHDLVMVGPIGGFFRKFGMINASRDNALSALRTGGVTIVFPGGDYDTYRPTAKANTIDFNGRTGYVRTALEAGVPLVPVVSIGGQETQYTLTRGQWLGKYSPLKRLMRSDLAPLSIGFPFGLTIAGLPNLPLPSKIVTRVLEPIHIEAEFGADPDIAEVDREVRARMQTALDELAQARRFPVLG